MAHGLCVIALRSTGAVSAQCGTHFFQLIPSYKAVMFTEVISSRTLRLHLRLCGVLTLAAIILGLLSPSVLRAQSAAAMPSRPTLFIVGDSTAHITGNQQKYGAKKRVGWGTPFHAYFNSAKIRIVNAASAGRSSRTFLREGKWARVLQQVRPGDFVLIQFGHNDPGGVGTGKDRGSLHGIGNQTQAVKHADGSVEIVHTFGWYLRKYVTDTRAKGATPILLTVTPRNIWTNGKPEEGLGHYRQWAHQVAEQQHVALVDISRIVSQDYARLGQPKVATFFPLDHTHTDRQGAEVVARCVVAGLKGLPHHPFDRYLSPKGQAVPPVVPGYR
jgi:lysophospholipase L1-like esterase